VSTFRVEVHTTIEITIDDAILALADNDDWVQDFYGLATRDMIAEHLAWNVGLHDRPLSRLDGFADRDDADVTALITAVDYDTTAVPT
jgi:hypothetical protein